MAERDTFRTTERKKKWHQKKKSDINKLDRQNEKQTEIRKKEILKERTSAKQKSEIRDLERHRKTNREHK